MSQDHVPTAEDRCCIFCCALIETSERDARLRWRCEFRALYNEAGQWASPQISGIGNLSIDEFVPVDYYKHRSAFGDTDTADLRRMSIVPWDRPDLDYRRRNPLYRTAWGYLGHVSCWCLFGAVLPPSETNLNALNGLCRSSPMTDGFLHLGLSSGRIPVLETFLDYKRGAAANIDSDATFTELADSPRTPMYEADPMELSFSLQRSHGRLKSLGTGIPSFMTNFDDPRTKQILATSHQDCFIRIPEEIRLLVLQLLPSYDVVTAKIASLAFALTRLSASFWVSRFDPGQEFHCVFERPSYIRQLGGWKQLYSISMARRSNPSFQNRQRIWKALVQLKAKLLISCRYLNGQPLRSYFESNQMEAPLVKRFAAGEVLIPTTKNGKGAGGVTLGSDVLIIGCKALASRLAIIPVDIESISSTLVYHNDHTFLAGLTFRSKEEGNVHIGYIQEVNQASSGVGSQCSLVSVDFGGNKVVGFQISSCEAGLCGIRAIFETGMFSTTLGVLGTLPRCQTLLPRAKTFSLVCDFDALKMVRLGISKSSTHAKGMSIRGRSRIYRDDYQWSPEIPLSSHFLSEPQIDPARRPRELGKYLPRTTCMYAGNQGEFLSRITGVIIWFLGSGVAGIEVCHGESSMILGSRDPFEKFTGNSLANLRDHYGETWHCKFDLDGPSGEIITDFHIPAEPKLLHVKICTNFGRTFQTDLKTKMQLFKPPQPVAIKYPRTATIVGIYADMHEDSVLGVLGIISKDV